MYFLNEKSKKILCFLKPMHCLSKTQTIATCSLFKMFRFFFYLPYFVISWIYAEIIRIYSLCGLLTLNRVIISNIYDNIDSLHFSLICCSKISPLKFEDNWSFLWADRFKFGRDECELSISRNF